MIKNPVLHKIHLFKEQREISCPEGRSILEATLAAQINHMHACGGKGICSTCRVSIKKGLENCNSRNKVEQQIANKFSFPSEIRLACQTKVNCKISIRRMVTDSLDLELISEQFSQNPEIAIGRQQKLTIVFTDIVNFTAWAEKFPPYDIVHVLNRYYRIMNAIIQNHSGFISDLAGDSILAAFGLDKKSSNSVSDAISAIKEMNEKLAVFNKYLEENFKTQFGIRTGVHYGEVIIGPFDTGAMKKLAIIGDNVNYASRIESANKTFGTKLLLSEEAYHQVNKTYPKNNLFTTTLKGKSGRYNLYEILY